MRSALYRKQSATAWVVLGACAVALGSIACGGWRPPAAAPVASAAPPVASAPAPATPAPPPVASAAPPPAPAAAPSEGGTGEVADAEEHRRHHGGGVSMLIAMSIRDLDLTADQKTAVEKVRSDLIEKMAPVRAADRELATILADGVAAGSVDKAKADKA